MYNRQPCVTDDSYQLSYEHLRQMECAGYFRASTEVSPFKFVSGKHHVSEKECFDSGEDLKASLEGGDYHICSVAKDMDYRMRTDGISSMFTASVLDYAVNSSLAAEGSLGTEAVENGKRSSSYFCDDVVNKRARQDNEAGKLEQLHENSFVSIPPEGKLPEEAEWTRAAAGVDANDKSFEAGNLTLPLLTSNTAEVAARLDQPAWFSLYPGHEIDHQIMGLDQLEDIYFQFSDHSHWRHVPVGPVHQADLPKWVTRDSNIASDNGTTSYADRDEASADKWLGSCVMPMPDRDSITKDVLSCYSKIVCDCTDEGSINCVRKHVMEARENLIRALGQEEFIQMGFSHMGEIVAQTWTEEEENLFHEVVLSNPESAGRNFWAVLRKAFPSSSFKELVSYYFNVFMLRKRAHQNRFDRLNVDSDNDEWQESSDVEFPLSEEGEEEEDSVVESPSDGKILSQKNNAAEAECEEHPFRIEGDKGFEESKSKSKSLPAIQTIDRNSTDSAENQHVQVDSCTSYEGLNNVSAVNSFVEPCNHVERDRVNILECRDDGILNLADYEHINAHGDSKSKKINSVGANNEDIDCLPTCNVIE
ncbi:hypothetical protein IEQ34_003240 [Dendrobium chrysotoxum]|uniref:Uncharacterized protein n=1 Tax=Dendrobium chrysotoxum TaxID=161865 RepID=A0AAV7HH29_DENCH|nr:hypothetical protein IEQ34_003240 [Dendrobium chrysotoxum]